MADRRDLREDKVLNPGHPLSEGLVGCWLFNEGAGGLVQDLSPNRNHGLLTNMAPASDWVVGPRGPALDFDGSNDYVSIPNRLDIPALPFSIYARIKRVSTSGYRAIVSKADSWATNDMRFELYLDTSTQTINFGDAAGGVEFSYSPPLNTWVDIAIVAKTGGTSLYVNGTLNESLGGFSLGTDTTAGVYIGSFNGNQEYWQGQIDFIAISFKPYSGSEIYQLYAEPFCMIKAPGPARYFSLPAVGGLSIPIAVHHYKQMSA